MLVETYTVFDALCMNGLYPGVITDTGSGPDSPPTDTHKIAESLYAQDTKKLQDGIGEYLKKSISFYDAGAEGFYHRLVLGLIALMGNQYRIRSNRESGDGRYDISMFPRENKYQGMIMELKWAKDLGYEELDALSVEALDQINEKGYDTEMREEGVTDIIKFGIAFSGNKVKILTT